MCAERWFGRGAYALLLVSAWSCASHSDHTKAARSALDVGDAKKALELYNKRLEVEDAKDLPKNVTGDNTVLILDRSMILQQLENYKLSSRDLEVADKQIEVLDFNRGAIDDIGKYMFSDATGPYKAPFYEKLLINTENMINYLQAHDLNGARIEARRLAVMQSFISGHEGQGESLIGPGSYFAGFIFEKSGDAQEALRYYDEALQFEGFKSLAPVVRRLAAKGSYRTKRITAILDAPAGGSAASGSAASGSAASEAADATSELLVVVNHGRVPAKVPKRVPIGLALTYASGMISPNNVARANELAAQGLVTWVNYPALGSESKLAIPELMVDGKDQPIELGLAVDTEANKAWDEARGALVASAITRLITRLVAGEVARKASGGGTLGALLSLGTQATLTATDVPDTRSWATLPARIGIARMALSPGKHDVDVVIGATHKKQTVELEPGGYAVLCVTELR